jgi:medium-chain acyl-[acyl-carrier-protein] hydrolase
MRPAIIRFARRPNPTLRLLCVPHAGGGSAAYRLWAKELPAHIDVVIAQLPGRESRISQPALSSVDDIVAEILPALRAEQPALPLAIFGHSMGALVAFELAHALEQAGDAPMHLFVSGSRAPGLRDEGLPVLHTMSDDDLLAEIERRYGGIPAVVREEPELMALLLPALRADITALERYVRRQHTPLACPITAFAGTRDSRARPIEIEAWRRETTASFSSRAFDGDHFFVNPHREAILVEVAAALHDQRRQGAA